MGAAGLGPMTIDPAAGNRSSAEGLRTPDAHTPVQKPRRTNREERTAQPEAGVYQIGDVQARSWMVLG